MNHFKNNEMTKECNIFQNQKLFILYTHSSTLPLIYLDKIIIIVIESKTYVI